ncbi:MAG: hypothetical protein RLZZ440_487 [Planctomycetota bacterium]|jgi:anti-anti-sigma regulatory factor
MATSISTTTAPSLPARADWGLTAERGPDWLFVRLEAAAPTPQASAELTESIWDMIREHHASRVVLEFDGVERLDASLWESISEIGARMRDSGGLVRVCSFSPADRNGQSAVPTGLTEAGVPCFTSRSAAVGTRPCPEGRCE